MALSSVCWLVINLDESRGRLEWMRRRLGNLAIQFERVPAVDGTTYRFQPSEVDERSFVQAFGRKVRSYDVACYLSHLKAMRRFLETPYPYAVIMEDDAWLSAAVPGIIAALTEPADAGDWDMVKLTGNNTLRALSLRHIALGYQLGVPFTRLPGVAAYLINRAAAQCYLERMLPMTVLFDHAFDRGWALGLRTRAVVPLPASGVNTIHAKRSTIDRPGAPKEKVTLWQKGPTLWWRTENEVSRVMFALAALFRSMRYRHSRKPSVLHAEPVPLREPARGSHPW